LPKIAKEWADKVLDAMVARMNRGDIQNNGFSRGIVNKYPKGVSSSLGMAKPAVTKAC
jgi:hypothetical protein